MTLKTFDKTFVLGGIKFYNQFNSYHFMPAYANQEIVLKTADVALAKTKAFLTAISNLKEITDTLIAITMIDFATLKGIQ